MDSLTDIERLGRLAAEEQDARSDEVLDLDVARRRFLGVASVRRRAAWVPLLAAAAVIVLASTTWFTFGGRDPEPLTFRVGESGRIGEVDAWLRASGQNALPVRFSDGTTIALEPGARARVTKIASNGATLLVENGRAGVSVVKRKGAAWRLSLGPFRVDVTGTRFEIDWDLRNERLYLSMKEGSVLVSGCVFGPGRSFNGGETVHASCRDGKAEISTKAVESNPSRATGSIAENSNEKTPDAGPSSEQTTGALENEARPGSGSPSAVIARTLPETTWQKALLAGNYREALDAAETRGFTSECATASAQDLVALGDAARYVGRIDRAVEAYQAVRRRFSGHERAAVAAFALGRVAFDQRADYADAARWFRVYLAEQPGGRLHRDALGRLVESLSRAGEALQATHEAGRYLERYPTGPHAEMARRLTSK